ncbi:unnamed protein product [Cladocopium goreaui]|uniref:RING-CH-type domain-containing protein n=1 Tax=Cladocopium goreaui TaxID=2562237 RepID=A0A9P1DGM4_9DINO|nr:unnamed protein product [Cladocopium goreaui]
MESVAAIDPDDASVTCRFCLGTENDEFVAPCECRGGQRWVHLMCLRRWQRSILVTQPTHPALIEEDRRITHCQVCLARLSCPVPSRHEMMLQFTGAELASLVQEQSLIVSSKAWSTALRLLLQEQGDRRSVYNAVHWGRSCYFIYHCGPKQLALSIPDEQNREAILENLDSAGQLEIRGKQFRVVIEGPLQVALSRGPEVSESVATLPNAELYRAISELQLPTEVTLEQVAATDRSDDSIRAINLTNRISKGYKDLSQDAKTRLRSAVEAAQVPQKLLAKSEHFLGGPCATAQCIVMISASQAATMPCPGFKVFDALQVALGTDLIAALKTLQPAEADDERPSKRRKVEEDQEETDEPTGPTANEEVPEVPEDEGSDVSEWGQSAGEFAFSGPPLDDLDDDDEESQSETEEADHGPTDTGPPAAPSAPWLRIFWGEARWQRTQLLGELARGDWGLCQAMEEDFLRCDKNVWQRLLNLQRPVYAPQNEMTRTAA